MSDDLILSVLTRLEAGQTGLFDRMSRLEAKMDDGFQRLDAEQSGLIDRMSRLEAAQGSMRGDFFDELGKTRGAFMERMDRLDNAITDIHADIAVNFGTVDHARRVNDNTRDEMRALADNVARMMTLILQLQNEVAELKGKPDGRPV